MNEIIINYLGIIPARSGSTGIKNKNILKINNKECFRYTLEPANLSKLDKIFFSTDSHEYLSLYKKYSDPEKDITFDYIRPSDISQKDSSPSQYIDHCLSFLKKKNIIVNNIVILQPTSLFRTTEQINLVIQQHIKNPTYNIKSVSPTIQSPYYMIFKNKHKIIENNFINRQEHKDTFIFNGAYYIFSSDNFYNNVNKFNLFHMDKIEGFDLDDHTDLEIINLLIKKQSL
tara:strand:- start:2891 stop:3580 length:690 start_codon:yes stop_codon:yes gene_type:complete